MKRAVKGLWGARSAARAARGRGRRLPPSGISGPAAAAAAEPRKRERGRKRDPELGASPGLFKPSPTKNGKKEDPNRTNAENVAPGRRY